MKIKQFLVSVLAISSITALTLTQVSCGKGDDCDTTSVSFKNDIQPILSKNGCMAANCHGATSARPYATYAEVKAQVDAQRLVGAVNRAPGFSPMPKTGAKIDDCSIKTIEAWVKQGAKDN